MALSRNQVIAVLFLLSHGNIRNKVWLHVSTRFYPGLFTSNGGLSVDGLRVPMLVGAPLILAGLLLSVLPTNPVTMSIYMTLLLLGLLVFWVETGVLMRDPSDNAAKYQERPLTTKEFEEVIAAARKVDRKKLSEDEANSLLLTVADDVLYAKQKVAHLVNGILEAPVKRIPEGSIANYTRRLRVDAQNYDR